eukprot:3475396-Amphidinium_carterae.1
MSKTNKNTKNNLEKNKKEEGMRIGPGKDFADGFQRLGKASTVLIEGLVVQQEVQDVPHSSEGP